MLVDPRAEMLADVQREIAALESQLSELRTVERYLGRHSLRGANSGENGKSQAIRVAADLNQADAAALIIREAGNPLKTGIIANRMIERGLSDVPAKQLTLSIYSTMSRKPEIFKRVAPGTWDLVRRVSLLTD